MTEPCVICGEPQSCPHLMRWYDNPKITPFIPGRGRIMEVPRGEEPAMYEVVMVGFPQPEVETDTIKNVTRFVPKRVVALEMASGGCKTVGVVLRDPDFPDPTVWEEPPRNAEGKPTKPVLKVSEDGKSAFLGTSDVVLHDSLVFEIREEGAGEVIGQIIEQTTLDWSIPLKVDFEFGENWTVPESTP